MSHFPCTKHFLQILQNLKINFDDLRRFAMRYKNVSKTSYRNNVPIILQAGLFRRSEFDHFHIKAKTAYISRVPQNKNEYLRKFNCAPRAVRYKLFTCQIERHFSNVFPRVRWGCLFKVEKRQPVLYLIYLVSFYSEFLELSLL